MAGVRQIIDGPGFTPLPNYLWDAAQHPAPGSPHWQQGVTWIERCGGASTVMDECLAVTGTGSGVGAQGSMSSTVTQLSRGATPFTVFAEFDCAPVGQGLTEAEFGDKAGEALARSEALQVSKAFWTGVAGSSSGTAQTTVYPHLAANATLDDPQGIRLQTAASPIVTGSGDDVAVVLGQLEYSLAQCYGGQGIIHIPYFAGPTFQARNLVNRSNDGQFYTQNGNLVVLGQGYTGSSNAGAAPAAGTSWIYATGAMFAYRSDVFTRPFPSTFDRSENTVKFMASRTYLIGFECCHFAALAQLGVPVSGGSSGT